ncbi:MAG TPA: hypothetical protein VGE02_00155 [Gemmatimonadales bacterium]
MPTSVGSAPLSRAVNAVRAPGSSPRLVVPLGLAVLLAIYLVLLLPWMTNWGATADERGRTLPGDELVPLATDQSTRAITVRAPADETWSWLVLRGWGVFLVEPVDAATSRVIVRTRFRDET